MLDLNAARQSCIIADPLGGGLQLTPYDPEFRKGDGNRRRGHRRIPRHPRRHSPNERAVLADCCDRSWPSTAEQLGVFGGAPGLRDEGLLRIGARTAASTNGSTSRPRLGRARRGLRVWARARTIAFVDGNKRIAFMAMVHVPRVSTSVRLRRARAGRMRSHDPRARRRRGERGKPRALDQGQLAEGVTLRSPDAFVRCLPFTRSAHRSHTMPRLPVSGHRRAWRVFVVRSRKEPLLGPRRPLCAGRRQCGRGRGAHRRDPAAGRRAGSRPAARPSSPPRSAASRARS